MSCVLRVSGLSKTFASGGMFRATGDAKKAVVDLSFDLKAGETLAIVGESGSGKSTAARMAMQLLPADSGQIFWGENEVTHLSGRAIRGLRRHIQMVFQDPFASLNPRMRIWESVAEGLRVHQPELNRSQRRERVADVLSQCGLDESGMDRYPHQFSGGQRQRIGIARALIVEPKVLVLDEPVSALDVSVQAQILNLLNDIQKDRGLAYLFISHDLSVVRHIADRVAVMFAGHVVEEGGVADVFEACRHPYTEALLKARPIAHPDERSGGEVVAASDEGVALNGCPFRHRCLYAQEACSTFNCRLNSDGFACLYPLNSSHHE
ncbi:peptide/nickel transport system ATP-binding protein/oligopeptide transport system ATP-binding protein [Mariprofundus ferrinatatus]|uniref:Peptide/nickel transport system ATP-binding protein/oligopeptide transport system ATP-binding protein n=1 Tax=Mariprofundus ferrinatatus TaxID=1921087 RepID=A0A2K8L9X0_9PROT|nr:oligopeptide/dipeptide ABC transporter ATP-binding protein [Mariprofundus ferrinatatus]ATX81744.1 peptide/nickel transport system ATP-binding protein/oligopeptide transport system ATP-binding protein [Mariprofundus ferrinatatus]